MILSPYVIAKNASRMCSMRTLEAEDRFIDFAGEEFGRVFVCGYGEGALEKIIRRMGKKMLYKNRPRDILFVRGANVIVSKLLLTLTMRDFIGKFYF